MRRILILLACLPFAASAMTPEALGYTWVRPVNRLPEGAERPAHAVVTVRQERLATMMPAGSGQLGLIPALIDISVQKSLTSRNEPILERLNGEYGPSALQADAERALPRHPLPQCLAGGAVTGRPDAAPLELEFRYVFSVDFSELELSLHARLPAKPGAKLSKHFVFSQDFFHRIPVASIEAGAYANRDEIQAFWSRHDGAWLRERVLAGIDDLFAMLDDECAQVPVTGRQRGRQVGYLMTVGAPIAEHGDRTWLRLRTGQRASVPRLAD